MNKVIFLTSLCSIVFASAEELTIGTILGCNAAIDNIFHLKNILQSKPEHSGLMDVTDLDP